MEAIRKIVTVKDNMLTVMLPDNYNNRKVELIILPAEEESQLNQVQEPKFDYSKLYGSSNLGMTVDEIDKELKALRNEWERDIS